MIISNGNFKKIEELLDGKESITIAGNQLTVDQLREMERCSGIINKLKNDVVVIWDDLIQFTTLGILDKLLSHLDINTPIDGDKFFYRGLDNSIWYTFISNYIDNNHGIKLEEDFIIDFTSKNYLEILKSSPSSTYWVTLIRSYSIYNSLKIVFRFKFDGIEDLLDSIINEFPDTIKFKVTHGFITDPKDESNYLIRHCGDHDIIMTQNMGEALIFIDHYKKVGATVVGPNGHNGISMDCRNIFKTVFDKPNKGPYGSELVFFNEGLGVG